MRSTPVGLLSILFISAIVPPVARAVVTVDVAYVSEYVFRGIEQQDAAVQPAITYTHETLSLGVWSSQALTNRKESWASGNEIDVWGTYGMTLGDATTLTVGGTAYLYGSARPQFAEPKHTWELSLGLSRTFGPVTIGATWYHDFKLESDTLALTAGGSFPLPGNSGTLEYGAYVAANDIGDADGDLSGTTGFSYRYFGAGLTWKHPLTSALHAKVGVHYVGVAGLPGAPDNLWFHAAIAAEF